MLFTSELVLTCVRHETKVDDVCTSVYLAHVPNLVCWQNPATDGNYNGESVFLITALFRLELVSVIPALIYSQTTHNLTRVPS